ncbi:MAG: glycosyltransferase family 2 protein [Phycisphaerae bacterium]|nr:glycosyltransferase family 2 protein [Phycisphaerae bacterium]
MVGSESTTRLLIVLPAYNEATGIGAVLADLRRHVPGADVVVVDDGSSDETTTVARGAGATVLRLPFNLGIGGALQTGYLFAYENSYDIAVQFDADGQHKAEEIPDLIQPILDGEANHVIGSRLMGKGAYRFPLMRRAGSWLIRFVTFLVTGRRIHDPTSGSRASGRRALAFFARHYPQAYLDSPQITVWMLRQGMRVAEVPVEMNEAEHSSIGSVRGVLHSLRVCVALVIDRIEAPFSEPMDKEASA